MTFNTITGKQITRGYSTGGISNIYIIDIKNFISYRFSDDMLYDECFVERIRISEYNYIEIESMDACQFQESLDNNIYKQQLTCFIRSLDSVKTSFFIKNQKNKYLIIFKTYENKFFTFGSDFGASIIFSQTTGEVGGDCGYNITITKNSIYPLFQIDFNYSEMESLFSAENEDLLTTQNNYLIPILELWKN